MTAGAACPQSWKYNHFIGSSRKDPHSGTSARVLRTHAIDETVLAS